jgi:hypothetical protein
MVKGGFFKLGKITPLVYIVSLNDKSFLVPCCIKMNSEILMVDLIYKLLIEVKFH